MWELPDSHAKVFIDPEDFTAVAKAARFHSPSLKPLHVIVATRLEGFVRRVIEALPKREKIKLRRALPFFVVEELASSPESSKSYCANLQIEVANTFIQVRVPKSLCSTVTSGPNTV